MYIKKVINTLIILLFLALFAGCDALDSLFSSAGSYKISILVNDVSLDECSFARANDKIRPYFEESVANDPDITALVVFLRDSRGELVGNRVVYTLEQVGYAEDDIVILVQSLDGDLPSFQLSNDIRMGRYSLISQVMSDRSILQRTEKQLFFLNKNYFSYEGINVYLPGITENSHLIPKETVIMLEADIAFENSLDPYIVWYDGRKKIGEGKISEGAGIQFWSTPEQSGFFSLRAEVFPIENFDGLMGYQKGLSLLVSSAEMNIRLVSRDVSQLIHWYVLEGNFNDSKMPASAERALQPVSKSGPKWMGIDGTYGIATGYNNVMSLPKIPVTKNTSETWQTLFRFIPIEEGCFFTILFDDSDNVNMQLSMFEQSLVLTLSSNSNTVSQTYTLPNVPDENDDNIKTFLTAGVNFSVEPGVLSAHINIAGDFISGESALKPISLEARIEEDFQILLGFLHGDNEPIEELPPFTALWDEFALYYMPSMEILIAELSTVTDENDENSNN